MTLGKYCAHMCLEPSAEKYTSHRKITAAIMEILLKDFANPNKAFVG
jgi:hypothetical protein